MNPIENILQKFPLVILDGAMATELERQGCDLNDSLWSATIIMENLELIKQVHTDYFAAGADCAITASYQATVVGFARRGLSEAEALNLIQTSVQIAVKARDEFWGKFENRSNRPKPIVAGSVGPYGAFLADGSEYRGDYTLTEDFTKSSLLFKSLAEKETFCGASKSLKSICLDFEINLLLSEISPLR